jgi:hypothetical protein
MQLSKEERMSHESKNRYSQFREQFDDIFEVTLSKKRGENLAETSATSLNEDSSHKQMTESQINDKQL